jgi:hypothetical protein
LEPALPFLGLLAATAVLVFFLSFLVFIRYDVR